MADTILGSVLTKSTLAVNGLFGRSAVEVPYDQDWWKLSLISGKTYRFSVTGIINGVNPILEARIDLMDALGGRVGYSLIGVGGIYRNSSWMEYTPTTSGTYYISAHGSGTSVGEHSISAESWQIPATINISSTSSASVRSEGSNGGTTPYTFIVTRSHGAGVSSVGYTVAGWASGSSTAASAADFVGGVLPAGTITFAAGETSKLLTINVLADTVVEGEERFKVTLANPKNATLGSSSTDSGVINNDDVPVGKVDDIFRVEGSKNGDGSTDGSTFGIGWAGKIRVMADFSKAVYSVRPWEVPSFNDVKPYSDQALESLTGIGKQGWMPVDLNPLFSGSPPIVDNIAIENRAMIGGFYTSGNSAAFLARACY